MHTVCAGATNRSAGLRKSKNCVERLMPALHAGVRGERLQRLRRERELGFSAGAPGSTSAPVSNAAATVGRALAQRLDARAKLGEQGGAVPEEAS